MAKRYTINGSYYITIRDDGTGEAHRGEDVSWKFTYTKEGEVVCTSFQGGQPRMPACVSESVRAKVLSDKPSSHRVWKNK